MFWLEARLLKNALSAISDIFSAILPPFFPKCTPPALYMYFQLGIKLISSVLLTGVPSPLQFFLSDDDRVVKRGRGSAHSAREQDIASQSGEGDASSTE